MHALQHRRRLTGILSAMALCTMVMFPSSAGAAGPTGEPVLLRPSDAHGNEVAGPGYFEENARPGKTLHLYAFVDNRGLVRAKASIVPVDAESGVYGGVSYDLPGQPRRGVGSWIRLSRTRVELGPGKGRVIPFSVTVPVRALPGQYIGAVTAFVPVSHRAGHNVAIQVQTRVVSAVVVNVLGPIHARLSVVGVTATRRPDAVYVIVPIRNSGNVLLSGQGWLWVTKPGKKGPVIAVRLRVDTTVPGTVVDYPVPWSHNPPPGRYRTHVFLWWAGGHEMPAGAGGPGPGWSGGKLSRYGWFWIGPHNARETR